MKQILPKLPTKVENAMNVSVIIPTRNRAKDLKVALPPLLNQDYPTLEYEIIVVDNGSTGNTIEITERAALLNKNNIRYMYEPEPGLLSGRHCGASEAMGEILVFVNYDIEAVNGWLSLIMAEFENESVHMAGGPSLPRYEVDTLKWIDKYCSRKDDQLTCSSLSLLNKGKERKRKYTMTTKKESLTYNDYVRGIQDLRPEDQLSLVEIISAGLKKTLMKKRAKHRITEIEGLGADIWKGIDAQEYVRKERESWD
jgi:glycosyltransferase involved in cell wall biosynthesis